MLQHDKCLPSITIDTKLPKTLDQKKIQKSKVLIVGIGGLGCPVADLLARSGVGVIGLIDYDKVNLSNIHRQTLFTCLLYTSPSPRDRG